MKLTIREHSSLTEIQADNWNALNLKGNPFLKYQFLLALESSACVSSKTGWQIAHFSWSDEDGNIQALLPHYYKRHSYGEYLFDWAWAEGINQAGIAYYPKAVAAIPFTPVPGDRLMVSHDLAKGQDNAQSTKKSIRSQLIEQLLDWQNDLQLSNLQCLFLTKSETQHWKKAGALIREGYQFSWYNNDYQTFDDFLLTLSSSPRKKIKRERRLLKEQNVHFQHLENNSIDDQSWDFFINCYQQTYLKRSGHTGYLNNHFFMLLRETMPEHLLLVCAYKEQRLIASSLFIKSSNILYGRYWGCIEAIDGLHYDCCYYQGIEYCIKNRLECLQPGTQGEYKRRRGFIPEKIYGAYLFNEPHLQKAISQFIEEESEQLAIQFSKWHKSSPYKKNKSGENND